MYFDMCVLILDRPLGKKLGKLNIVDKSKLNEFVFTYGYPGKSETNVNTIIPGNQYYSSGEISKITNKNLYYDFDTEPGQSGSPVFNIDNDVIAIHTKSFGKDDIYKYNAGLRLSSDNLKIINQWNNELKSEEYHKLIYLTNEDAKIWSDLNLVSFINIDTNENGRYFRTENLYTDSLGKRYALIYDKNNRFVGFLSIDDFITITPTSSYKEVQLNKENVKIYKNLYGDLKTDYTLPFNGYYKVKEVYNLPNNEVLYKLFDQDNKWLGYVNDYNVHEIKFKPFNERLEIIEPNNALMQDIFTIKNIEPNNLFNKVYDARFIFIDNNNNKFVKIYDNNNFIGIININATKNVELEPLNKIVKLIKPKRIPFGVNIRRINGKRTYLTTFMAKYKMTLSNGSIIYSIFDPNGEWVAYVENDAFKIL